MSKFLSSLSIPLFTFFCVLPNCFALTVTKVLAGSEPIEVNKRHTVNLTFAEDSGSVNCGISVNWGDGKIEKLRVGESQQIRPPFSIEHLYTNPGSYKVTVDGETIFRGLKTLIGCNVKHQSTVLVKQLEVEARVTEPKALVIASAEAAGVQVNSNALEPQKTPPQNSVGARQQELTNNQTKDIGWGISYDPASFNHYWIHSWGQIDRFGDNRRTLFRCNANNSTREQILFGNEISWRGNDADSILAACSVWVNLTQSVLSGKDLTDIKKTNEGENQTFINATFEGKSSLKTMLMHPSKDSYAGWYEVKGDKFFSLGTFASPLKNKPASGKVTYKGDLTIDRSSTLTNTVVSIDFSNNQVSIFSKFLNKGSNEGTLETLAPIKFDPNTGIFRGELVRTTYRIMLAPPNQVVQDKVQIGGVVGGEKGNFIAATLHAGAVSRSFDFLVMKRQ
jgi:hypothetical protein